MNEALEERVAKLEAAVSELRSIIGRHKSYSDFAIAPRPVKDRLPPEYWAARARAKARANELMAEMFLAEVRRSGGVTQDEWAETDGITQPTMAELDSHEDMPISTLRRLVRALGGELGHLKPEFVNSVSSFAARVVGDFSPAIRLTWAHPQFGFAIRRKVRLMKDGFLRMAKPGCG